MYTPGFAPPEQFHDREHLGPWSDIYSTGAAMYACLAGVAPQRSDERLKKDLMEPAVKRWAGQYSPHLLETIDWCLNLDPLQRPQSVYALQKELLARTRFVAEEAPSTLFGRVVHRLRALTGKA
jgi:serine/threonine protein kinase